jgi:glycosyltransferase involved in cell wall biosynthesis
VSGIAGVLIAKNEAHVISRALQSLAPLVDGVLVALDASTSDDTAAVARGLGARVIECHYTGSLAHARNEAIDLAHAELGAEWILMCDPDDVVEGFLPEPLEADVYDVVIHDGPERFLRPQLFRPKALRYWRPRHEEARIVEGARRELARDLVYLRVGGGWLETLGRREKFMGNVRDLLPWLESHPEDASGRFLIAQCYRDAGELELARSWYEARIAIGPAADQETFRSALEIAFLVEKDPGCTLADTTSAYLRAHELQPMRAEPLFHLACALREQGAIASAWLYARRAAELEFPKHGTILDVEVYTWKARGELALDASLLGDRASCKAVLESIMTDPRAPGEARAWALELLEGRRPLPTRETMANGWPLSGALHRASVDPEQP